LGLILKQVWKEETTEDTMEAILNELQEDRNASELKKKAIITEGYFKTRLSDSKFTLKLKGDINNNNVYEISKAMIKSKFSHKRFVELDMSEVETIDMQAMSLLIINLKTLEESGMKTKVTGIGGENLKLANDLGIRFITQIK
jgi:anti-anti-sigma regulatory factor